MAIGNMGELVKGKNKQHNHKNYEVEARKGRGKSQFSQQNKNYEIERKHADASETNKDPSYKFWKYYYVTEFERIWFKTWCLLFNQANVKTT